MIKALLKKQWLESIAFLFYGKDGKRRSTAAIVGFGALMVYAFGTVVAMFYMISDLLCSSLIMQGLDWVYFAFTGTLATAFGIVGGIFTAKTKLYEAKDNDLLLSMPIPSWLVLFSRTVGLYVFTLLFESLVFLPASVCYFITVGVSGGAIIGCLLTWLVMPFGALAVCYVLGWLLAFVTAKLPVKNLVTTLLAVGFMVLYFAAYSKINEYLSYVIANGGVVAEKMQTWLYPFGKMGEACTGNFLSLLVYVLIFMGLFALVYAGMAATYLRLVTTNRGGRKTKYVSKERKQGSVFFALLKKEFFRFTKNPMVALNCLLGTAFCIILPFILLFSRDVVELFSSLNFDELIGMAVAVIVCAVCSMNMISAASVSLEGENLWVLRVLPVSTERILLAKGSFHFFATAIPALFAGIFVCILLKISFWFSLLALIVVLLFNAFTAALGLTINLKLPNLHWTSELHAVKQNMSAMLSMFLAWGILAALVGGYFLFGKYLFAGGYMLFCIALLTTAIGLLCWWLQGRGKKIFEDL